MMRRWPVVLALGAGAVLGCAVATVGLVWSGCASAGGDSFTTTLVTCATSGPTNGFAVMSYPGLSDSEIAARVTAMARGTIVWGNEAATGLVVTPYVRDGGAFVGCAQVSNSLNSIDPGATISTVEFSLH